MSKLDSILEKVLPNTLYSKYANFRREQKLKKHAGKGVVCVICKSEFSSFATFGANRRKNARCLTCDSLERHRLLWKYITEEKKLLEPKSKIKVMHFAPEKSFYDILSDHPNIEYVPCDFVPEQYNYGGKVSLTKVNITEIPFPDNHFDVVLCAHVLEHIPDDIKAMSELRRVMKPTGWGVFQVPIDYTREKTYEDFTITSPAARKKAFGRKSHVRWYGQDYKDRLKSVGLKVTEDDYVKRFSKQDLFKYGLVPNEMIYYCEK
jgi:SAM-dependent methyltransferase